MVDAGWTTATVNITIRTSEDWADRFQLVDPLTNQGLDITDVDEIYMIVRPQFEDARLIRRLSTVSGGIAIENAAQGRLRFSVSAANVRSYFPVTFGRSWKHFLAYQKDGGIREIWRGNLTVLPGYSGEAWTPLQFGADLVAWFTAKAGVYNDVGVTLATNGQTVQQWNDQSGHNFHLLQATAGQRPTFESSGLNNLPCIRFVKANSTFLKTLNNTVALGAVQTVSCFIVFQRSADAAVNYPRQVTYWGNSVGDISDYNNAGSAVLLNGIISQDVIATYRNNAQLAQQNIVDLVNYRAGCIFDGVNNTIYVNNVASTPVANSDTFTSPGTVGVGRGDSRDTGSAFCDDKISEIVLLKKALSIGERELLDNYFRAEWGI